MIISIDGPSGSGKSTVAGLLAKKLGFNHFNSGKLYRAIACYYLFNKYSTNNLENEKNPIPVTLNVEYKANVQHVSVNGTDYTPYLYENEVSVTAPLISKNPYYRSVIDVCQRQYAKNNNVVIDGRDIGSYVFPDAEYKFYLDCDIKVRAERRFKDLNKKIPYEQILKELAERDKIDRTKKYAPLIVPRGAIIIDSTNLNLDQTVDKIYSYIK